MGYSPWGHQRVGHDLATEHVCTSVTKNRVQREAANTVKINTELVTPKV